MFFITEIGVNIDIKYISREIQILSEIRSERVVRYMKTWIDNNNSLYIQMEFCSDNLRNILDVKQQVFQRSNGLMNELEYYISCKILIELLQSVQYLHDQDIIHRDLKPTNILFDEKGKNGIFFKICDFGLAKLHDGNTHTRGMGTPRYIAPEVSDSHYDTKSDVYSLSVIGHQIFDLDHNW